MLFLLKYFFCILHLVISQGRDTITLKYGQKGNIKTVFQNSIWRCSLCQNQTLSHKLIGFEKSKEKVKTTCRDVLVLVTSQEVWTFFMCQVARQHKILRVSLYALHSSLQTLGGWGVRFNSSPHKLYPCVCSASSTVSVRNLFWLEKLLVWSWGAQNGKTSLSQT